MRHVSLELPPRYRRQALARLDGLIARRAGVKPTSRDRVRLYGADPGAPS